MSLVDVLREALGQEYGRQGATVTVDLTKNEISVDVALHATLTRDGIHRLVMTPGVTDSLDTTDLIAVRKAIKSLLGVES